MKKIMLILIAVSTALSGMRGLAADINVLSVLEADAEQVMPESFVLDDDFVFADKAPNRSSVAWSITKSGSDMCGSSVKTDGIPLIWVPRAHLTAR